MPESVVVATLATAERRFASRHIDLNAVLAENFAVVARHVKGAEPLSAERRRLIGAYFTQEYSIEAAALTNPSIVEAPDQSNLAAG